MFCAFCSCNLCFANSPFTNGQRGLSRLYDRQVVLHLHLNLLPVNLQRIVAFQPPLSHRSVCISSFISLANSNSSHRHSKHTVRSSNPSRFASTHPAPAILAGDCGSFRTGSLASRQTSTSELVSPLVVLQAGFPAVLARNVACRASSSLHACHRRGYEEAACYLCCGVTNCTRG